MTSALTPDQDALLSVIIDGTRMMMGSFGGIAPHSMMISSGGELLYLPGMDVDKRIYAGIIKAAAEACGASIVFFIAESWAVNSDTPDIGCPPSEHPDRKEVVMVSWTSRAGQNGHATIEIARDAAGKPSLVQEVKRSQSGVNIFLDGVFTPTHLH